MNSSVFELFNGRSPRSEPGKRLAGLVVRRRALLPQSREAQLKAERAEAVVKKTREDAERALAHQLVYGRAVSDKGATQIRRAEQAFEREAKRARALTDAIRLVESELQGIVDTDWRALLAEAIEDSEGDAAATRSHLEAALAAVESWTANAKRQEVILTTTSDHAARDVSVPHGRLRELRRALVTLLEADDPRLVGVQSFKKSDNLPPVVHQPLQNVVTASGRAVKSDPADAWTPRADKEA